ncbi:hypothetical protein L484_018420 [Morus notabilis]|uniref:C2H2-type domain-containing protein n=1 Tax=Morus notabilis TaxID=981085 RepID=W9QDA4_9ROSA|nr:hypothetical protein L484_018420 [Morus notabilis]
MAPMEKQVPESDPQKYCEEWFTMANTTGKEFELPNISNSIAASSNNNIPTPNMITPSTNITQNFVSNSNPMNHVPNLINPHFANTQRHLLSHFPRPSPLRIRNHGNNIYLNGVQAMTSAIYHNGDPLANNLSDGTNYPMGNDPFVPLDPSTFVVNPNRSMVYQQQIPTLPGPLSSGHTHLRTTITQITEFHFLPNIGESSTFTTPTPISSFPTPNYGTPIPISAPSQFLDDHLSQVHQTLADLGDLGVIFPVPPLAVYRPNHFCPACNYDLSFPHPNFNPPGASADRAPQRPRFNQCEYNNIVNGRPIKQEMNDNVVAGNYQAQAAAPVAPAPEEAQERRAYTCPECNASFRSGNALGGHMSAHARKRKREMINRFERAANPNPLPPEDCEMFAYIDAAIGINNNNVVDNMIRDVAAVAPLLGDVLPAAAAAAAAAESITIENPGELDEEFSSASSTTYMAGGKLKL